MTKIEITGVVGFDTTYEVIAKQLDSAKGNVEILINSPGGYVYDGIAIYNSIKKYDRGKTTIKVLGLSASIASYIMLAGNELILEENSVVMIHNPSICVMGDYRKLRNAYTNIEKLRNLMSNAYSKYTGIEKADIETMMDAETFFIGKDELKTWGNMVESSSEFKTTKGEAEIQIQAMCSLVQKETTENAEKLVALLSEHEPPKSNFIINKPKETQMENQKLETLSDLKTNHPKLYAEAVNIGIEQEKSRIKAHLEFLDIAPELSIKAIKEDTPFLNNSEIQAKYIKARINKDEIAIMEKDNNPEVIQKPLNEAEELKSEIEKTNAEAEEKIKAFMPHLNNKTKE